MGTSAWNREEIFKRVSKIVSIVLFSEARRRRDQHQEITMTTDIYADLGMDSVESLDFLTALEEEFDVNPDQFEASQKRTITQIVSYVEELLKANQTREKR